MMAFCPEHPKWDQNPKFTSLSETTSTPPLLYAESFPRDDTKAEFNNCFIIQVIPILKT